MAESILKAVQTYFTANTALTTAITGGMWTSEVPENTELPYACLEHEGTVYEHEMSTRHKAIEYSRFCIHVYGVGAETVDTLTDLLVEQYRAAALPFTGKTPMSCYPLNSLVQSTPSRYRDGTLVYHGTCRFDAKVSVSQ